MKPVSIIAGIAVPLLRDNIDTDTIIPSREMRSTGRTGLADGLFAPWRYTDAAARLRDPDFALNRSEAAGARILLAGCNFGCGSSREHAVWALAEYGIEAVVAPGFAPIFRSNCIRNGLLPVELPEDVVARLQWQEVRIDLPAQTVSTGEASWPFEIEAEAKEMLVGGVDAIDLTLSNLEHDMPPWLEADRARRPWIYLAARQGRGE